MPIVCSASVGSAVWIGTGIALAVAVAPVAVVAALAFDSCFLSLMSSATVCEC